MAVQQTECYRVVTIGYLKDFIGTLIQDSSNGSVKYVNLNALSEEKRRDDYCPTYGELTSGTIIQTWDEGEYSPNGDRDGIVVNSSAILGGNYAENQLVDQRDLSLMYTRIKSFSISASPTGVSACANSSTISYTHTYNRNSKYMNSSCVITSGGNTAVTDNNDSEVNLTANYSCTFDGWSNHTKELNIPKNSSSTGEADERYIKVTGQTVFRGATGTSVVTITQSALTASWEYVSTSYGISAWRVYPTDGFRGCKGDLSYLATGEGYTYTTYIWKDSCGDTYQPKTETSTTSLGTSGDSFGELDCCDGDQTNEVSIPFNFNGKSTSVNFVQSCSSCASDPSCSPTPPPPTCARGTDNGTDIIDGVSYSHPMLLCSTIYVDDDSTYVQDIKYNGVQLSTTDWVTVNDWLQIKRDPYSSESVCGYGWIRYNVTKKNDTGSIRRVTLSFSTTDSEVCTDSSVYKKYGIRNACQEWDVEVKQAPCGYYWCGDHSYTSVLVPCGSGCEYGSTGSTCDDACDCGSGPEPPTGTCTCSNLPVVNPASISVGSDGDNDKSIIYTVTNDCSVSISTDSSSWIHLTDRPSQSKVDVVIEGNQSTSSRSGNIFFEIDGDTCRTVPVSQEGASSGPYTYTVNFINNSSANGGVSFHLLLNDGTEITSGGASIGSSGGNWSTTLSTNTTIRSLSYFYGSGGGWSGSFDSSSYSVSGYGTKTITVTITKWE